MSKHSAKCNAKSRIHRCLCKNQTEYLHLLDVQGAPNWGQWLSPGSQGDPSLNTLSTDFFSICINIQKESGFWEDGCDCGGNTVFETSQIPTSKQAKQLVGKPKPHGQDLHQNQVTRRPHESPNTSGWRQTCTESGSA